jgi:hypothetical protein
MIAQKKSEHISTAAVKICPDLSRWLEEMDHEIESLKSTSQVEEKRRKLIKIIDLSKLASLEIQKYREEIA